MVVCRDYPCGTVGKCFRDNPARVSTGSAGRRAKELHMLSVFCGWATGGVATTTRRRLQIRYLGLISVRGRIWAGTFSSARRE